MEFFKIRRDHPVHAPCAGLQHHLARHVPARGGLPRHQGPALLGRVHRRHGDGGRATRSRPTSTTIRDALERVGFTDAAVQNFGTSRDVLIRLPLKKDQSERRAVAEGDRRLLQGATTRARSCGASSSSGRRSARSSPRTARSRCSSSAIGIVLYLWLRFEWKLRRRGDHRQPARRGDHPGLLRVLPVGVLAAGAGRGARGARLLGERVGGGVRPGARELPQDAQGERRRGDRRRDHRRRSRAPSSPTAARR